MPNTDPVIDTGAVLEASLERAREEAVVRVGFLACVSVGQKGEQLAELGDLADRGAAGFTDDGRPVWSAGLLRRALQYARPLGLPIALHCEEPTLSARRPRARGGGLGGARLRRLAVDRARARWSPATCASPPTRTRTCTCSTCRCASPWRRSRGRAPAACA